MPKKSFLLLATAALLAFAFASPPAASPTPGDNRAQRRQFLDSLRSLTPESRRAAVAQRFVTNRAAHQSGKGRKTYPPRRLMPEANPFLGNSEKMVSPAYPGGVQEDPSAAFDGTNYLVVWDSAGSHFSSQWEIYGTLVSAAGAPLHDYGFVISDVSKSGIKWFPRVAFDGTNYLVVWEDNSYASNYDIYGALVSKDGVAGTPFPICAETHTQESPWVAYDGFGHYLVVWQDWRSGEQVRGALVNTAGGLDVQDIAIDASGSHKSEYPRVASDGGTYLVVWDEYAGRTGIHGRRVTTAGEVLDPAGIDISDGEYDQSPDVAFDGTNYLVVWYDWSAEDIYAALVPKAGAPGAPFAVCEDDNWHDAPAVAFDGTDYVVAWLEDWNSINGCRVDLTGGIVEEEYFAISERDYDGYPALACGPVEGKVIAVYQSETDVENEVDYGGQNRVWSRVGSIPLSSGDDVSTVRIERPTASFLMPSWDIPPKAWVHADADNSGPRSFKTTFYISNSDDWTSTKTVLGLKPDETRAVGFDPFPLDYGVYTTECYTELANDGNPSNDEQDSIFQGCNFIDFFDEGAYGLDDSLDVNWERGKPSLSYWTYPPMDQYVWGVGLDGTYNSGKVSYLNSPTYEVLQDDPAIAFQHNFNITDADAGGNFAYSYYDEGESQWTDWEVLSPDWGLDYNATPDALDPDPGWTGNSSGWQQSVFTIPLDAPVDDEPPVLFRVGWKFASNNSENDTRGWLIDEVAGIGCTQSLLAGRPRRGRGSLIDTLKMSSNPLHGAGQVVYTLLRNSTVNISLFDAAGRLVQRVATSGFQTGLHTARVDASGLAPGVYFVKLAGNGDVKTTKVIIE